MLNKKAARPGSYDPNWFLPNRNEEEPEEDQSHPMTARQLGKIAAMRSEIEPQEHQQRVADRLTTDNPRMLLYHGLGTGKSLASILGAETAKKKFNEDYGIVAPASLRENFSNNAISFVGLSLLLVGFILVDAEKNFPGYWALLPTWGAFLIILAISLSV